MGSGTGLDMRAEDALDDSSVITAVNVLGTGPDGDWLTSISSFLSTTYKCFTFTNVTRQISAQVLISLSLVGCRKRPRTSTVTAEFHEL